MDSTATTGIQQAGDASATDLASLADDEKAFLSRQEAVIERGRKAFVEVGAALAEIRDRRLYRETHETFETYVKERWDFGRAYAYRLIGASETMEVLSPIGDIPLPATESQIRPLLQFPPEDRAAVWADISKRMPLDGYTARDIEREVRAALKFSKEKPYKKRRSAIRQAAQAKGGATPPPPLNVPEVQHHDDAGSEVIRRQVESSTVTRQGLHADHQHDDGAEDHAREVVEPSNGDTELARLRFREAIKGAIEHFQQTIAGAHKVDVADTLRELAKDYMEIPV